MESYQIKAKLKIEIGETLLIIVSYAMTGTNANAVSDIGRIQGTYRLLRNKFEYAHKNF